VTFARSVLIAFVGLATATSVALAQPQVASVTRLPPALFFEGTSERLGITRVAIETTILGNLAETRMTLTFGNTTPRARAGDLYVPLPPDATVSGYALDVAGRMVDGVVVPKDEARRIFEKEVRKGVDPGLVEWTRGNVFKTRVFPIPANGSRTVRLSWVAPLEGGDAGATYALPLAFDQKLAELSLRIEIVRGKERPKVTGAGSLALTFDERLVAEVKLANQAVVQDLKIVIPDVSRRPVQVERSVDGRHYFTVRDWVPPATDLRRITPKRLRVLWDASLSRESSDRGRELELLRKYLGTLAAGAEVELVVVRNEAQAPRKFAIPAETEALVAWLTALPNDGGTQLARLSPGPGAAAVDLILVFSDGLSTFGDDSPKPLGAPAWFVSSSAAAGHDTLRRLAADNGGVYLDLGRVGDDAALAQIGRPVWSLLSAVVEDGKVEALLPAGAEPAPTASLVAGVLTSERAVVRLSWGVPGQAASVVKRFEITRPTAGNKTEVLRFAWAHKRLADLMSQPTKNADLIVDLGKAQGIVTPGTSLLVLETLAQYLEHRVRPPATWPEMRADWDREIENQHVAAQRTEAQRLDEVQAMWKGEIAWYERRFDYPENFRFRSESDKKSAESRRAPSSPASEDRGSDGIIEGLKSEPAPPPAPSPAKLDAKPEAGKDNAPEPGVSLTPWDPTTPWTTALKAAAPDERVRVYLAQRATHGTAPSFYLDCADFFLKVKDEPMALQVLSNIAELKLDDPPLLRVLAHRLAQLGQLATAATIFEEVLRLRPEEPQSHRDLALVLGLRAAKQKSTVAAKADWQGALDHLAAVVKRRWDRFEAIEIIALHELNRIWTLAQPAGATLPLDARFVYPMELDARIVMTWDADATDMDLHVIEPSNEEADYSHNLTTIGGKVSRDFTQGYGPEIYGLRRAMHGTYKVKTKFYGSSAANLIGAVTLQVDVFTNWGRPNEKRQSMTLRLTDSKEEFVVGEIEF